VSGQVLWVVVGVISFGWGMFLGVWVFLWGFLWASFGFGCGGILGELCVIVGCFRAQSAMVLYILCVLSGACAF
jgi:hypothetical protein